MDRARLGFGSLAAVVFAVDLRTAKGAVRRAMLHAHQALYE